LKSKPIDQRDNFLLIEIEVSQKEVLLGAIYVPPKSLPPFELFEVFKGKEFFLFGDFNAKHNLWACKENNTCGVEINRWLEEKRL